MRCKHCESFYLKYPLVKDDEEEDRFVHVLSEEDDGFRVLSDPLECAFPQGVFTTDNWGCETMKILRDRAMYWRDDDRRASLGVVLIPDHDDFDTAGLQMGYLVMSWYKNRGRTGTADVIWDGELSPLALATAYFIIESKPVCYQPMDPDPEEEPAPDAPTT